MSEFDERFEKAIGRVSFAVNGFILEYITRVMRELNLDLDSVYILGVLVNLDAKHQIAVRNAIPHSLSAHSNFELSYRGIRLADLTQVTCIPRETVRRKLCLLLQMGKVERDYKGHWKLSHSDIGSDVRTCTKETVVRYLQVATEVQCLLNEA